MYYSEWPIIANITNLAILVNLLAWYIVRYYSALILFIDWPTDYSYDQYLSIAIRNVQRMTYWLFSIIPITTDIIISMILSRITMLLAGNDILFSQYIVEGWL